MKTDGLKHGRPQPTIAVVCECECSRFLPCPANEKYSPCKAAYVQQLKDMKAKRDKQEAK